MPLRLRSCAIVFLAGYYIYSVKPRGLTGSQRKTKLETFIIFNQQFLTLVRAGLPILGSLEMLAKSQKNANFAGQLQNVAARVRTGESISSAFEAQGGFPVIYTTTLLAGERSGNLEEVLGRFLSFQRIALTFRKKLTGIVDLSGGVDYAGFWAVHFSDFVCGAAFRAVVRPDRQQAARAYTGSAGGGKYCPEICSLCDCRRWRSLFICSTGGAKPKQEQTASTEFASSCRCLELSG